MVSVGNNGGLGPPAMVGTSTRPAGARRPVATAVRRRIADLGRAAELAPHDRDHVLLHAVPILRDLQSFAQASVELSEVGGLFFRREFPVAVGVDRDGFDYGGFFVGIDGEDINDTRDIARVMNNHRAGDTVKVTVYRGKRRMEFNVVLGEAESEGRRT